MATPTIENAYICTYVQKTCFCMNEAILISVCSQIV